MGEMMRTPVHVAIIGLAAAFGPVVGWAQVRDCTQLQPDLLAALNCERQSAQTRLGGDLNHPLNAPQLAVLSSMQRLGISTGTMLGRRILEIAEDLIDTMVAQDPSILAETALGMQSAIDARVRSGVHGGRLLGGVAAGDLEALCRQAAAGASTDTAMRVLQEYVFSDALRATAFAERAMNGGLSESARRAFQYSFVDAMLSGWPGTCRLTR